MVCSMPTRSCVVIDSYDEFLKASTEFLSIVTHVYFTNCNIRPYLSDPTTKIKFYSQLTQCMNITNLNFSNTQICDEDLIEITLALTNKHTLSFINLRHNNIHPNAIINFELQMQEINCKVSITAVGALSMPDSLEKKWQTIGSCNEAEIFEMIEISEFKAMQNPMLRKIHGVYTKSQSKFHPKIALENIDSNMPFSTLLINGKVYVLPKFLKMPNAINEYNYLNKDANVGDNITSEEYKTVKLAICRSNSNPNLLEVCLIKTYTAKAINKHIIICAQYESNCIQDLHAYGSFTKRIYKKNFHDDYPLKTYTIMPYINGPDSFEVLLQRIKHAEKFRHDEIYSMPTDFKSIGVIVTLAHIIELMLLHSNGIIHNDVKPENFVFEKSYASIKAIDFEAYSKSNENESLERLMNKRYSIGYVAPERSNNIVGTFGDAYSCGCIIRQFLFPVACRIHPQYSLFFSDTTDIELRGVDPEFYLKPHFEHGIQRNFSSSVANIVTGLTQEDYTVRLSLPEAFMQLSKDFPGLATAVLKVKLYEIRASIIDLINIIPNVLTFLIYTMPDYDAYLTKNIETIDIDAINYLFQLRSICNTLKLFQHCNGMPPQSTLKMLEENIRKLRAKPIVTDLKLLANKYHDDYELELLNARYKTIKDFILNRFSIVAFKLIENGMQPESAHIRRLCEVQTSIRTNWHAKQGFVGVAETVIKQYHSIIDELTTSGEAVSILCTDMATGVEWLESIIYSSSPENKNSQQSLEFI